MLYFQDTKLNPETQCPLLELFMFKVTLYADTQQMFALFTKAN